ncbi:MAG: hypothetical protein N7Q72_02840 [Spiroplasma sp. Tabriz.8]|nr:hypothetical protein [Spiroplasma sp. Tabriz.8]
MGIAHKLEKYIYIYIYIYIYEYEIDVLKNSIKWKRLINFS